MSWLRLWRKEPRLRPIELVVMRLSDMALVHPQQDDSRVCSKCGEPVGIYPSSQAVLARRPDAVITCQICSGPLGPSAVLAPGALDEPFQSQPATMPRRRPY
jgi:hypothetical protein